MSRTHADTRRIAQAFLLVVVTPILSRSAPLRAEESVQFVDASKVRVTDRFWRPMLRRNRDVTVPHNLAKCREVRILANFERVAGRREGDYFGLPNWDEFLYKAVEAGAYSLIHAPNDALEKELDEIISIIAEAQDADGYLRTIVQLSESGRGPDGLRRWTNLRGGLELYCAGHLIEAGVTHFQATGKRTLLNVALANAELIDRIFGPGKRIDVGGHQEIELALIRLFEATRDHRWLDLAKFFVDTRGTEDGGRVRHGAFCQDHAPLFDQTQAVGQAPRATYFYSGAADVGRLSQDPRYHRALRRLWDDVVGTKMYIQGGIGSKAENEGFGEPYVLPNRSAYSEICAAISFPMWATRMFREDPRSDYFDVVERTFYNNLAAGVSLEGNRYFYACPPESDGKFKFNLGWFPQGTTGIPYSERSATRKEWFPCACCPPNFARYLPLVPSFIYATREDQLYVNLFVAGKANVKLAEQTLSISQKTNYPWDGRVKITINSISSGESAEASLLVRIPGWARCRPVPGELYCFADALDKQASIAINDGRIECEIVHGFAKITRSWSSGDVIELNLPMPVRRVLSNPSVKANVGKVALQRGPIVYCFESVDNDGRSLDLGIPDDANFDVQWRSALLGGTYVLTGDMYRAGQPYRATGMPYYLWSNRGPGEMVIWLTKRSQ